MISQDQRHRRTDALAVTHVTFKPERLPAIRIGMHHPGTNANFVRDAAATASGYGVNWQQRYLTERRTHQQRHQRLRSSLSAAGSARSPVSACGRLLARLAGTVVTGNRSVYAFAQRRFRPCGIQTLQRNPTSLCPVFPQAQSPAGSPAPFVHPSQQLRYAPTESS